VTTRLRVVVDQLVAPVPGAIGRYTRDLTRALIAASPARCEVAGIVSSSPPADYSHIEQTLPGLAELYPTSLARRELAAAWQMGLTTSPGGGIIHSPSLFAPLRRHDPAVGDQVVVTVHETQVYRHPDSRTPIEAAWQRAMLKRARKHADAVVVPTHALAQRLAEHLDFGDRIRVISTAARSTLEIPPDAMQRARALALPSDYLVSIGSTEHHRGVTDLVRALARPGVPDMPLIVLSESAADPQDALPLAQEAGLPENRVRVISPESDMDLAVLLSGATAFVAPAHDEGDPATLIEPFLLGTPVIHSDAPEYLETAAGCGLAVPVAGGGDVYIDGLAAAVAAVVTDTALSERLSIAGQDRARAFSWRDAAERVWQLHADL
jgi:glycosyltransferase involved in cell wall biosynthesis